MRLCNSLYTVESVVRKILEKYKCNIKLNNFQTLSRHSVNKPIKDVRVYTLPYTKSDLCGRKSLPGPKGTMTCFAVVVAIGGAPDISGVFGGFMVIFVSVL